MCGERRALAVRGIRTFLQEWSCFEALGRLKTHQGKTQFYASSMTSKLNLARFGWNAYASSCMEVLGTIIGPALRDNSPKEQQKIIETERLARRSKILPVSLSFKKTLIATLLPPRAVWGWTLNGRAPPASVSNAFLKVCKELWKGNGFSHTHASTQLFQVIGAGHPSDLLFSSVCRTLRWMQARSRRGVQTQVPEAIAAAIQAPLQELGWTLGPHTVQGPPGVPGFDLRSDKTARARALHELRTIWRLKLAQEWFGSDGNYATAARSDGVPVSRKTVQTLHVASSKVDGWGLSVMMGAMGSPAVDFRFPGTRVQQCWHCGAQVVRSTLHVLWDCQAFASFRVLPRPAAQLAARLGWSPDASVSEVVAMSQQLGQIRSREVARRGRLQGWIRCATAST